ncbi:dipeptide ABC transporter ATP-binding protein [Paenirhodobacter sp.]|uniref:dipeptide ABC transporter ATP-binding protein n=1 Tax=Paenirhodobacter sp. TaxID=1965326 RepID=UPI003B3D4BCB
MTTVLDIRNLSVEISGQVLVDRISFDLGQGETLALVGESGSGKSLSLLAATGIAPRGARVTGEVVFEGRNLLERPAEDLRAIRGARIGYVFQDPQSNLHPYKTIFTQIAEAICAHQRRLSRRTLRDRVTALLRDVGIRDPERRMHDLPRQFSGGMRQRVMIAMALALEPVLLIADEPTTALDVTVQAQILALLRDLQRRRGLSVLFVSHDLAVVSDIADRIAVMQAGRIVEQGATGALMRNPAHPYSRRLLGAASLAHAAPGAVAAPSRPALLRAENIQRRFGAQTVLEGVHLQVGTGEIVALVGESGSGKTTLGRIVAGLDQADGGVLRFDGTPLSVPFGRQQRRNIQVVFQDPYASLNPHRRIGAILEEPLRRFGSPLRVAELLEAVSLPPEMAHRLPGQLSGGQRQRVAIARAIAPGPKLIVADEPVSALDITTQVEVLDLLARLRRDTGLSLLLITHDLGAVARYCDRVAVLCKGRLVEQGPVARVFATPAHEYTRALLDAIPGQQLRAQVEVLHA